jgi:c-di-GMP-binding flagellar brake protein YcgR
MKPRIRSGDRRQHLRFEVAGELWGSVDFGDRAILRDIAAGGILVETSLPCMSKSIRGAQVAVPEGGPELTVIVRHVSAVTPPAESSARYLVGLEFMNLSPTQRTDIERLVDDWRERPQS